MIEGTPKPFVSLCMEPDELADWNRHNRTAAFSAHGKALTPCEDCLPAFALEMRAIGRCNGEPGGVEPDEQQPHNPTGPPICRCGHHAGTHRRPKGDTRMVCGECQRNGGRYFHDYEPEIPAARRDMATVKVNVTAPCATCIHEPVCERRHSIEELDGAIAIEHEALPKGLGLVLAASVDCDAYLRSRASRAVSPATPSTRAPNAASSSYWTPERRAEQAERMRGKNNLAAVNAARLAEREAAESVG